MIKKQILKIGQNSLYINIDFNKPSKITKIITKEIVKIIFFTFRYIYKKKYFYDFISNFDRLDNKQISFYFFFKKTTEIEQISPFSKKHNDVITMIYDIDNIFLSNIYVNFGEKETHTKLEYLNIKRIIHGIFNIFQIKINDKNKEKQCFDDYLKLKINFNKKIVKNWNCFHKKTINMIASENFPVKEIYKANGSFIYYKYAEGYPGKRYYEGCEYADKIEQECIDNCCLLFNAKYANVQSYSGTLAVISAVMSLEKFIHNNVILSFDILSGGHISHGGLKNSMLYKLFRIYQIKKQKQINLLQIEKYVKEHKPSIMIIGFSAYTQTINYRSLSLLLKKYKIKIIADISHISGLIAAKLHPNPIDYCDIVVSTTHKTLNGPRGAFILTNKPEYIKTINSSVFPLIQGGPFLHTIYAKNLCFIRAASNGFKKIQENIINYALILNKKLNSLGIETIGITENHTILIDLTKNHVSGKQIANLLSKIGIITNENLIFTDKLSYKKTSGLRLGTTSLSHFIISKELLFELAKVISNVILNYNQLRLSNLSIISLKKKVQYILANFKIIKNENKK